MWELRAVRAAEVGRTLLDSATRVPVGYAVAVAVAVRMLLELIAALAERAVLGVFLCFRTSH